MVRQVLTRALTRNRKILRLGIVALCLFLAAGCADNGDTAPPLKNWTLILYLNGDDVNMQADYLTSFEEMIEAAVGSTADVNIVVQFDRYPERPDLHGADPRFGGWVITHRFYITPGMEPTEANAIKDWGDGRGGREVDMSDPATLTDFIGWATRNYPAKHYMLMVADHGYGWMGLNADMTSFGNHMTVRGLKEAIDNAGLHIDLLVFNACLMQMIEVAYELHDSPVDIMVGSEMPGVKWPLADILKNIMANPLMTAREIGRMMNDLYVDITGSLGTVTLSTLDLSRIRTLTDKVKELVAAMLTGNDYALVKEKAGAVMAGLDEVIVYSRANRTDAHGMTIYFPEKKTAIGTPELFNYFYQHHIIRFSTESMWRDFLAVYFDIMSYPQYHIDRNIFAIRNEMKDFEDPNIDLYDFCQRIREK
jgi:hypothetical protein